MTASVAIATIESQKLNRQVRKGRSPAKSGRSLGSLYQRLKPTNSGRSAAIEQFRNINIVSRIHVVTPQTLESDAQSCRGKAAVDPSTVESGMLYLRAVERQRSAPTVRNDRT